MSDVDDATSSASSSPDPGRPDGSAAPGRGDGRRSNRRVAIAIIVAVILLPVIGVVSAAVWGDERQAPTEVPQGSGGGLGG